MQAPRSPDLPTGSELLDQLDGARAHATPTDRLRAIRRAAHAMREVLLSQPQVRFYASVPLIQVPYPTRFAFRESTSIRNPFIYFHNRLFVVQVDTADGVKTILVSPSDHDANRETPWFKRLAESMPAQRLLEKVVAPQFHTVQSALAETGIRPDQVDYITYDHLHTQDIRQWLGGGETTGVFPNAKLLVTSREWSCVKGLLPPYADWYPPRGTEGVHPSRVVLFDQAFHLGGFCLVPTPGHTEGNHSIVVHTPEGLLVTSENGVSADCYAPSASQIPGLRQTALDTGVEVIMNGNTLECGVDQYLSMVLEKELAGPSKRNPAFPNFVPSSELVHTKLNPRVRPTFSWGPLRFGSPAS